MKKVKASWAISFPEGSVLKVKVGDFVEYNQLLLESISEHERVFDLNNELKELSASKVDEINRKFGQKEITTDDVLFEKNGWFSRKITFPICGTYKSIDELKNLHVIVGKEKCKVCSPVESVIEKIGDDEIILEFIAEEYLGKGINDNRGWVGKGLRKVGGLSEISHNCTDQVILIERINEAIAIKADVIGVGGIVVLNENNGSDDARINIKAPALSVPTDVFNELESKTEMGDSRLLIDGSNGRLLLVVTK